jgi:hypothetical protein
MTWRNSPETFWRRVDKGDDDECWNWTAWVNRFGYGQLSYQGRRVLAHRLAFELAKQPIPDGMVIRHTCDNPKCCNPAHLEAGTQADNVADCATRRRTRGHFKDKPGSLNPSAKLTEDQVREIRESTATNAATAALYGVGATVVSNIRNRRLWRHVE